MRRVIGHRHAKPDGEHRFCLRCDQEFTSLGRFNRICPDCRAINEGHVAVNKYRVVFDDKRHVTFHMKGIIR